MSNALREMVFLRTVLLVSTSFCLLGVFLPDSAFAENVDTKLWPRFRVGNEIYADVVYKGHDASRVKFEHSAGVANLPISELPWTLQKRLDYDPAKAAENEAKLAAEQDALQQEVQANIAAAQPRSAAAANSSQQPEEKNGMIKVIETEVVPPDEVRRLGITGLQRYRQPGESPIEQLERESKTGVIRKVWKWVPKPEPVRKQETPEMQVAKKKAKLLDQEVKALGDEIGALRKQQDSTTDVVQQKLIRSQIEAKKVQQRSKEEQYRIEKDISEGR